MKLLSQVLLFTLFLFSTAVFAAEVKPYPFPYLAKVNNIVDGDTIDLDVVLWPGSLVSYDRFRLYGIDTPETRTKDDCEKEAGFLAKDFVSQVIPVGSEVVILLFEEDKYGRYLINLYPTNSNVSINQLLLDKKLAVEYYGAKKPSPAWCDILNQIKSEKNE